MTWRVHHAHQWVVSYFGRMSTPSPCILYVGIYMPFYVARFVRKNRSTTPDRCCTDVRPELRDVYLCLYLSVLVLVV
jgi:hypothetical protein